MIHFLPMTPGDCTKAVPLLRSRNIQNCEHCFATMLVWGQRQPIDIAFENGALFMRSDGEDHLWYLYPRGAADEKEAVGMIISDAESQGKPRWIYGLDEEKARYIGENFSDVFKVVEDRDSEDYIYLSSDLINLPGKKYQKKRNHCSKFSRENPDYRLLPITAENINTAKDFERRWGERYNAAEDRGLASEQRGIMLLLDNFEKLNLTGAMLKTGSGIVAMTIASSISDEMADVVVEKAYHDVPGAYSVINRDFAAAFLSGYKYINREDDMGQENLRKAKMSYFPYMINKKYFAIPL